MSSYAKPNIISATHLHISLTADFDKKVLCGYTDYTFTAKQNDVTSVELDVRTLSIGKIFLLEGQQEKKELKFDLNKPNTEELYKAFGAELKIHLDTKANKGDKVDIRIYFETQQESAAIQWLDPEQTAGKKYGYLFSQCQAIHARSMIPCQDTPLVKQTYTASIRCKKPLVALMSATRRGQKTDGEYNIYEFEQTIPIPSYLLAIAVGALDCRKIGPRSHVWSEKEVLDDAEYEFSNTEDYIKAAESFLPKYEWGNYDLLLLPPSFPYGGMENPQLTFVTPTLIAKDRSLTNVVAHEIAHSWSGNLVTNSSWEDFWLNEGFTVYIERRILSRIQSQQYADFDAIIGYSDLKDDVDRMMKENPSYTQLIPKLENVDPDDAFSSVPYEKGFNFLYYLATEIVGRHDKFEKFLNSYFTKFARQSISTEDFKSYFLDYFKDNDKLDKIDWNDWLYSAGMPKMENKFDTTLAIASQKLAEKWIKEEGKNCTKDDISGWSTNQIVYFLQLLFEHESISHKTLEKITSLYGDFSKRNSEIKFIWFNLCIKNDYTAVYDEVIKFITEQGRMKFVRPLYRALYKSKDGKELAIETFKKHQNFYHNIAKKMIAMDLKLNE